MKAIVRLVPAAVAACALGAMFLRIDIDAVRTSIVRGHLLAMIPWAVVYATGSMALQANWDRILLAHTPLPPSYLSVWAGKVGTAVLNAVGYSLGSGGYIVWIARATNVGAAGSMALLTIAIVADLAALSFVELISALVGTTAVPNSLVVGAAAAFGVVALIAVGLRSSVVAARLAPGRLRNFFTAAAAVPLTMWSAQVAGRSLSMCCSIAATAFGATAFGLDIPIAALCSLVPAAMLVQVLPVNVAGFGAAQVAFVVLFSPYETSAKLLAFHLLWQLALNICFVLRGLPFLKRATVEIANA